MVTNFSIKPNQTKMILGILGCFAFAALGVLMAYLTYRSDPNYAYGDRYFGMGLGGLSAIIFCFFGFLGIKRVVSSTPPLQALNTGLLPGWIGRGNDIIIPWEQISEVAIFQLSGQEMLGINLHDHKSYLAKLPRMKRIVLLANRQVSGFLIGIPATAYDQPLKAICATLHARCVNLDL
jgi:hypothetical protein